MPWAYFDGASSEGNIYGDGVVIHLNLDTQKEASVGFGNRKNNYAEIKALHLLLC